MLKVSNLSFDYQDKPLLSQVSFSLAPGQLLHLHGANGTGKTTVLKLLAGLFHPHEGQIEYGNEPIHLDLAAYQQKLCYVGHKVSVNPSLTVRENCLFDMHWGRRAVQLEELLVEFGLQALIDEPCAQLSAGQRRRVALLRMMMTDASLWLLDEPLVALDKNAVDRLMSFMASHLEQGGQIILTSHQTLPLKYDYLEYFL